MTANWAGRCRGWLQNVGEGCGQQKAPVRLEAEPGPFGWNREAAYLVSGPSTGSFV